MSRFIHECVPLVEEEDTCGRFSLVCARLKCVRIRPFIGVCFLPVKHLEREKHRAHSTEGTAFPGQYVYVRMRNEPGAFYLKGSTALLANRTAELTGQNTPVRRSRRSDNWANDAPGRRNARVANVH